VLPINYGDQPFLLAQKKGSATGKGKKPFFLMTGKGSSPPSLGSAREENDVNKPAALNHYPYTGRDKSPSWGETAYGLLSKLTREHLSSQKQKGGKLLLAIFPGERRLIGAVRVPTEKKLVGLPVRGAAPGSS